MKKEDLSGKCKSSVDIIKMKECLEKYQNEIAVKDDIIGTKETKILKNGREINFMQPFFLKKVHEHYAHVTEKLKEKAKSGSKIKVAFFVMYESIFPAQPLFEMMSEDPFFETNIVVITHYSTYYGYSKELILANYNKAYQALSEKYPKHSVLKSYDPATDDYSDFAGDFDIVFLESPYMHLSHPYYLGDHFLNNDVLTAHINYGYIIAQHTMLTVGSVPYSTFWKVFVENYVFKNDASNYEELKGENLEVSGSVRMDALAKFMETTHIRKRKKIIIAPHHACIPNPCDKEEANFFKYAKLYLELPKMYPDIDFVYRPHPYAMDSFALHEGWSVQKVDEYINTLKSYDNVTYSGGGEHLHLFADSDGIIHDCGSFLCEYLFTYKPACFVLRPGDMVNPEKYFNVLGRECLENCYKAFSEEDIINFIEEVIIKDKDVMEKERRKFVDKKLKINYPVSTKNVINFIKKELGQE